MTLEQHVWTFPDEDLNVMRQAAMRFLPTMRKAADLSDDELIAKLLDVMRVGATIAIMRRRSDEFATKGVRSFADLLLLARAHEAAR